MPTRRILLPRTSQPLSIAALNPRYGIRAAITPRSGGRVFGAPGILGGAPGDSYQINANGQRIGFSDKFDVAGLSELSVLWVGVFSSGSNNSMLFNSETSGSYFRMTVYSGVWAHRDTNSGDTGTNKQLSGAISPSGSPQVWIGTFSVATNAKIAYVNGAVTASAGAPYPLTRTPSSHIGIGTPYTGYFHASNKHALLAFADRAWTPDEVLELSANPWLVFAPQAIYVPRSAGAAGYTHPTLSNARMIWTGPGAGKPAIDYTW